jgi:signal transduction histidine kinase
LAVRETLMTDEEEQDQRASLNLAFAIGGMNHFRVDVASGLIAGGPLVKRLLGEPDAGEAFRVERLLTRLDATTGRQLAQILTDLPRHDLAVDVELVVVDHAAIDAIRMVGRARTIPTPILAGIMVDETERRRSEELLRGRAADLAAANRQLEQFTHIVSHDLKSPLRGVHHLASFLREDLGDAASPQVLEHLDKLDRQVTKMSRMLDDLQTYVHVDRRAGKIETVDLEALGVELGELVGLPDGFTLDVDVEPVRVETDRTALSLVLRNLLDNSFKHHDRRSGMLRIEARPHGRGRQRFRVIDDGPGIVRRYRKRVFEPFHCLGGAGPGSGMGLAFVKRAVERQGGRVWIEDGPGADAGRGVAFCFTWPLVGCGKPDG